MKSFRCSAPLFPFSAALFLVVIAGCGGSISVESQFAKAEAEPEERASYAGWVPPVDDPFKQPEEEEAAAPNGLPAATGVPVVLSEEELNVPIGPDEIEEIQFVAALDKNSGELRWKRPRNSDHSYSTPLSVLHDGVPQIVSVGGRGVAAYEPATGRELWWFKHDGHSVVPRPVYGHGLIYICTGYNTPVLMAIDPSGELDITETHLVWKAEKGIPFNASPLLVEDGLYLVSDMGVMSNYDAETGAIRWQKRLRGHFSVSPTLIDGLIHVANDDGVTYLIEPGDEFKLVGQNELEGPIQASPAVSGRALFVRTETHLYRIEEPAAEGTDESFAALDWPQFRGPGGQGFAGDHGVPREWSEEKNIVWKTEIPGRGWSSPVVQGNQIWLTTGIEEDAGPVQLQAVCVDRESGKIVHQVNILRKLEPGSMHPRNSHATPTPVIDGDSVFVHFGSHATACVSTSGELRWRTQLRYHHHHGPAGSPVVVGDMLVINCDGYEGPYDIEGAIARGEKEPEEVVPKDVEAAKP